MSSIFSTRLEAGKHSGLAIFLAAVLAVLVASLPDAVAEPVYVRDGERIGQGYALAIERTGCFVVTVAHNLENDGKSTIVFDQKGTAFPATVKAINRKSDLAVLDIGVGAKEMQYQYTYPEMCQNRRNLFFRDLAISGDQEIFTWLDSVATSAGGLSRAVLGQKIERHSGRYRIPLDEEAAASPTKGDSGAPVFALSIAPQPGFFDTPADRAKEVLRRIFGDPANRAKPFGRGYPGYFIGLVAARDARNLTVVPAHEIVEFLLDSLVQPAAFSNTPVGDLPLISKHGKVVARFHGDSRQAGLYNGSGVFTFDLRELDLYAFTWILDFGDRDHIPKKITIRYSEDPTFINNIQLDANTYSIKPIGIFSSNAAPGQVATLTDLSGQGLSKDDHMDQNGCKSRPDDKFKSATGKSNQFDSPLRAEGGQFVYECDLYSLKVARTLVVTAHGRPGAIKAVEIEYLE